MSRDRSGHTPFIVIRRRVLPYRGRHVGRQREYSCRAVLPPSTLTRLTSLRAARLRQWWLPTRRCRVLLGLGDSCGQSAHLQRRSLDLVEHFRRHGWARAQVSTMTAPTLAAGSPDSPRDVRRSRAPRPHGGQRLTAAGSWPPCAPSDTSSQTALSSDPGRSCTWSDRSSTSSCPRGSGP